MREIFLWFVIQWVVVFKDNHSDLIKSITQSLYVKLYKFICKIIKAKRKIKNNKMSASSKFYTLDFFSTFV